MLFYTCQFLHVAVNMRITPLNLPLSELSGININHARRPPSPADDSYSVLTLLPVKSSLADVPILSSTDVDFIKRVDRFLMTF